MGSIKTSTRKSGDKWIISGQKLFITNASYADTFMIMAKTDETLGKKEFSAFIVTKGVKGLRTERMFKKLGVRSSDTAGISLDNVEIPEESLIGGLNKGFEQAMEVLDSGRIGIAAMAVGIARASLESAIRYAKEREQFGRPIAEFEAIKFMLADMAVEIEAARLLTERAIMLKEDGKKFTKEASMAKLFALRDGCKMCNKSHPDTRRIRLYEGVFSGEMPWRCPCLRDRRRDIGDAEAYNCKGNVEGMTIDY